MGTRQRLTATTLNPTATALSLLIIVCAACCTLHAQETPATTATPAPSPAATSSERPILKTIKLNVQYGGKVPVARKHFYLSRVPFNLDALQQKLGNLPSHKDYQQRIVSQSLNEELVAEFVREWLERYRCETVYCQPITLEDVGRIRLFQEAYKSAGESLKKAGGGDEMALRWLPNFLPSEISTGYFDLKMNWIKRALAMMETETIGGERNQIRSVMTDRKGEAYIPDIKPGATYYISNLVPIEDGKDCFLWMKKQDVKVGPGIEVGVTLGMNTKVKEIKGAAASALTFTCAPPK